MSELEASLARLRSPAQKATGKGEETAAGNGAETAAAGKEEEKGAQALLEIAARSQRPGLEDVDASALLPLKTL